MAGEQYPHTVDQRGDFGPYLRAAVRRAPDAMRVAPTGAEGGPGKRAGSGPGTAPRSDPYVIGALCGSAIATLVERFSLVVMLGHLGRARALAGHTAVSLNCCAFGFRVPNECPDGGARHTQTWCLRPPTPWPNPLITSDHVRIRMM